MTGASDRSTRQPRDARFHRAVLEHSHDVVTVADAEGRLAYVSPALRRFVGYDPEELEGTHVLELVHPEDRPQIREHFAAVVEDGETVARRTFRIRDRDGSWRAVEAIATNLLDEPAVEGILVTFRDVTSLHQAEAELDHTRMLLRDVVTHAPIVLWRIDAEGVFQLSEGRGLEALGLEPGQVVGESVFDVYAGHPEGLEQMRRVLAGESVEAVTETAGRTMSTHMRPVRDGDDVVGAVGVALDITEWAEEAERAELRARLLDQVGQAVIATDPEGRVIYWNPAAEEIYGWSREEAIGRPVMELTVPEPSHSSAQEVIATLQRGERWSGEYVVKRKDGTRFPAWITNVPVMEDGELTALIGVSADLTARKALEDELRQSQKLEAVGQLAGGIAHEFNNLLTTIGGYATLAAERTGDPQVTADLKEIGQAARRARGLADKLLAFSRRRTARVEAVDLNALVRGMIAMITRTLGDANRVEMDLEGEPWRVRANPTLAEQAILNLALNARDAMPAGGVLTITTHRVTLGPDRIEELGVEVEPGDFMRLTVEDTGTGIPEGDRARIFDPFFTTKGVGKGSGLGMSMVYGAVRQVGGGVTVASEVGVGTRVSMYLPRMTGQEQTTLELGDHEESTDEAPWILVVEDEPAVLSLARRVLVREGYTVVTAQSGEEARKLIEDEGMDVDLVVTDVIMPEMSGPELVQRLRGRRPRIRSLFMSGYAADELESRGLDRREENFLAKPFGPGELVDAVRDVLAH